MQAISMDLRVRVLAAAELAERFVVSPAWVRRLRQRHRATGEVAPGRPGTRGCPSSRPTRPASATCRRPPRT